jgi:hypothetical protein
VNGSVLDLPCELPEVVLVAPAVVAVGVVDGLVAAEAGVDVVGAEDEGDVLVELGLLLWWLQ